MEVRIFKDGNAIRIKPATSRVISLLEQHLTYTKLQHLMTFEERREHNSHVAFETVPCYEVRDFKHGPQAIAGAGFRQRVTQVLEEEGITVRFKELRGHPRPQVFKPNWNNLKDYRFRYKQRETLQAMAAAEYGRVWWATGSGKTWLIPPYCRLFPKARIVITTKFLTVLETIYSRLIGVLPSVGIKHSKKSDTDKRIVCMSSGSLHHAVKLNPDIILADEVHELGTDAMFERFAMFPYSRFIGMSANNQDRQDGADFELEGFFGPLVAEMSYQEAEANGLVVPIKVHWGNVIGPDYAAGLEGVEFNRQAYWRNDERNAAIAKDARLYPKDEQVLITCSTLEHACNLKYHLPEFKLCYAPSDGNQASIDGYKQDGLIPLDTRLMTRDRLKKLQRMFEANKLKKVIATTVWNRGVDFVDLGVLIRGDGGSNAIDDTQIPGRLSRISDSKSAGIMHDYRDQFNDTARGKASRRKTDYKKKGWKQVEPKDDDGSSLIRKNVMGLS